jgi:outer membrane protein assembly factor BamB
MRRSVVVAWGLLIVLAASWPVAAGLISGTVRSVDGNSGKLVVETSGGKAQTLSVPDDVEVTLDNKKVKLADIAAGLRVSVTTADTGAVTRVRARSAAAPSATPRAKPTPEARRNEPAAAATSRTDTGWTQYAGPGRDNKSAETGLLQAWAPEGPPLVWTARNLGMGYSSVSVSDGKVLTMGSRGDDEYVIAVDLASGDEVWSTRIGRTRPDGAGGGPRGTPTIDGDKVYALGANGDLACLNLDGGRRVWGGNILQEFGGNNIGWGISESPLVDGERVIVTPGGRNGTMVALNKNTGKTLWKAQTPGNPAAAYASAIAFDFDGVRQYVNFTHAGVIGVKADDGQFLWGNGASANGTANCSTPLHHNGHVFSASAYSTGGALVKLTGGSGRVSAELVYKTRQLENHHGDMVIIDGYLYGTDGGSLLCLDVMTGDVKWQNRSVGKGAVVYADGRIILRSEQGPVALVEATPDGYREHGRFDQPNRSNQAAWPHPVVADGKLFLRDQANLLCYNLRE